MKEIAWYDTIIYSFNTITLLFKGDSGGAIMTTLNHLHWHVGVASFISQNGCETPEPSGFTRTFPYVAWIKSVTGIV